MSLGEHIDPNSNLSVTFRRDLLLQNHFRKQQIKQKILGFCQEFEKAHKEARKQVDKKAQMKKQKVSRCNPMHAAPDTFYKSAELKITQSLAAGDDSNDELPGSDQNQGESQSDDEQQAVEGLENKMNQDLKQGIYTTLMKEMA